MSLILPFCAFVLFYLILREREIDWRRAALAAAIGAGSCVVLITETLSVPRFLTRDAVAASWLGISIISSLYLLVLRRRDPRRLRSSKSPALGRSIMVLLAGVTIMIVLIGIIAIVAPPSTWDAMEYHLPRVIMWMTNRTVRFYPTPDYGQLVYGPGAEYALMHIYLLWGGDRFVNLLETFSLLGSAVGVSLIAQRLGAGPRGQALAAIVSATIPEGVLEASGPMNTYVGAFWITVTVAFLMQWTEDPSWLNTVCAGLAAGLALLTKGTAYVYLPFLVLACWWMGSSQARILFLKRSFVLVLLILALNGPQYLRCFQLTGTPLGVPVPESFPRAEGMVHHLTLRRTLSNVLRNLSLHLGTSSEAFDMRTEHTVRLAIRAIGDNPDDPEATWLGDPYHMNRFSRNEIFAGNPLHLGLSLTAFGMVLWSGLIRKEVSRRKAMWYALGLIAAFTLFCASIQWTMWSSRYHLPLFVLASALVGLVLEQYFPQGLACAIGAILVCYGLCMALMNRNRSLIPWHGSNVYHPRNVMYFYDLHDQVAAANIAAANAVVQLGCNNVAIDSYIVHPPIKHSPKALYVYPLFALMHADGYQRKVWYTGVDNLTNRYVNEQIHTDPCAVVCLECVDAPQKWKQYQAIGWRASVFDYLVVFGAAGAVPNPATRNGMANLAGRP